MNDNGKMDPMELGYPIMAHPWLCGCVPAIGDRPRTRTATRLASGRMEFYADVHQPDIVYSDRMTLKFGGQTVELIFPGKNHANDGHRRPVP